MSPQHLFVIFIVIVIGALLVFAWHRYAQSKTLMTLRGDRIRSEPTEKAASQTGSKIILAIGLLLASGAIGFSLYRNGTAESSRLSDIAAFPRDPDTSLADVDTMIGRLVARLEADPTDGEGFRMLGWAYLMTDRPADAIAPYRKAIALLPDDAGSRTGLAEALTATQDGVVTEEAIEQFRRALNSNPSEPRARYFAAKYDYQNGRKREALDAWITLANEAPGDAVWQAELRRDIGKVASDLDIDVSGRLVSNVENSKKTGMPVLDRQAVQAGSRLSSQQQAEMIEGMVSGLAARLAASPQDPDGWVRLLRSRVVRGETEQASADLATARRALAGDASGLSKVNAAAEDLQVQ